MFWKDSKYRFEIRVRYFEVLEIIREIIAEIEVFKFDEILNSLWFGQT